MARSDQHAKGEMSSVPCVTFNRLLPGMLNAVLSGEPVKDRTEYVSRNAALYGVDLKNLAR